MKLLLYTFAFCGLAHFTQSKERLAVLLHLQEILFAPEMNYHLDDVRKRITIVWI